MNIKTIFKELSVLHKSISFKQRLWYNFRWQLSTPTLAIFSSITVALLTSWQTNTLFILRWPTWEEWIGAAVANFIGANIFIYVDKLIFKPKKA